MHISCRQLTKEEFLFFNFSNLVDLLLVLDKTDITSFHTVLSDNNFYSSGAEFAVARALV